MVQWTHMNFKKFLTIAAVTGASLTAKAEGNKNLSDSAHLKNKTEQASNPTDSLFSSEANTLKPGEKFKEIIVGKEFAGIKVESMVLIPSTDTTKEVYLVSFSGEGDNLIGKELLALKNLGLKPASRNYFNQINPEAFKKVRQSVKAIDRVYSETEDLGQGNTPIPVKVNETIDVKNQFREQTTEVGAMNSLGTTFEYVTIAYKEKKKPADNTQYDLASNNK